MIYFSNSKEDQQEKNRLRNFFDLNSLLNYLAEKYKNTPALIGYLNTIFNQISIYPRSLSEQLVTFEKLLNKNPSKHEDKIHKKNNWKINPKTNRILEPKVDAPRSQSNPNRTFWRQVGALILQSWPLEVGSEKH